MDTKKSAEDSGEDEVGRREISLTLGVSEREITNLIKAHHDFPSIVRGRARTFPRRRCVQWYVRFKSLEAVKRAKPATPSDDTERRRRREEAEMKMVEMDVAEREARLVSVDHVDQVVGEVCERLRAIIVNMPGNFGLRLEELGVDPAKAEGVLTAIADELTAELRGTADDVERGEVEGEGELDTSVTDEPNGDAAAAPDASGTGVAAPD